MSRDRVAIDRAAIERAAVVGTTAWGTTLAVQLARGGLPVGLVARTSAEAALLERAREHAGRLPGTTFPPSLSVATGPEVLPGADLVCFAVPSGTLRENARAAAGYLAPGASLLSATKGLVLETGQRMSELLREELPGHPVAVLSGPNLSREVAAGYPASTVIASTDAPLDRLRDAFHSQTFRVYTSRDTVGVEFGGALKNVLAIAAGIVDELGFGDNTKAALMARGLAEITRLAVALGADPLTLQGLSGMGDMLATAYSPLSRNHRLGEMLARGQSLEGALEALGETAEGAATIPAALALAARHGLELPIARALNQVLFEGASAGAAVHELMSRRPTSEAG